MTTYATTATPVRELKYPLAIATYEDYALAHHAVGHLGDQGFPVDQARHLVSTMPAHRRADVSGDDGGTPGDP